MRPQKLKAAEDAADGKVKSRRPEEAIDDDDDYEMMCVRGGSPMADSPAITRLQHHDEPYYRSDDSYTSSYDSYDDRRRRDGSSKSRAKDKGLRTAELSRKGRRGGSKRRRGGIHADDTDVCKVAVVLFHLTL